MNAKLPTGEIELSIEEFELQSTAEVLPILVSQDGDFPEELRLRYRFLDLRRERMHANILLRSRVIASIRRRMIEQGFIEFQTPILTSSAPRARATTWCRAASIPAQFYALPQAPQQFKQLLMVAGFDRYFQIAPCFRDEDGARRPQPGRVLPARFRDVVRHAGRRVRRDRAGAGRRVRGVRATGRKVTKPPFPRIAYDEAMLKYGTDKPDLRNPLVIVGCRRGVPRLRPSASSPRRSRRAASCAPSRRRRPATKPRSFFDKLNDWARGEGAPGLGYIVFEGGAAKGPIAKFLDEPRLERLRELAGVGRRRCRVLRLRQEGQGGEVRRRRRASSSATSSS